MFKRGDNGGLMVGGIEYSADITALFLLWIAFSAFSGVTSVILSPVLAGPVAILLGVGLVLCLLMHEAGHAYTAINLGTPIRGIKLFMLGGMAMMTDRPRKAWKEFAIAIAGPLVSVALWILLSSPKWLGVTSVWAFLLAKLGFYNFIIAVFNMVPAFPLDGGRVFRSIVWGICRNALLATKIAVRVSEVIVAIYLIFSLMNIAQIGANIMWNVVIGFFICYAGETELKMLKTELEDGE